MLSRKIVESDAFLSLPLSAQALYMHLNMEADDDGFVGSPERLRKMLGAKPADMDALIRLRFVIAFGSGVVAIKHWCINNSIKKDRYRETTYTDEKSQLVLRENGRYSLLTCDDTEMEPERFQNGSTLEPQYRLGKDRLGKDRKESGGGFAPPTPAQVDEYCAGKGISIDSERFVDYFTAQGWRLSNGNPMKDWRAAVRNWHRRDSGQVKKGVPDEYRIYD